MKHMYKNTAAFVLAAVMAITVGTAPLPAKLTLYPAMTAFAETDEMLSYQVKDGTIEITDYGETAAEAATNPEAIDPVDEGATIRKSLNVAVFDVIFFDEAATLVTTKGKGKVIDSGERIWIVGDDDADQRFRVYVPSLYDGLSSTIYYLGYADCTDAQIDSDEEGLVIGDLAKDGVVNVCDLCLMRSGYIYGWNGLEQYYMADMNADGFVSISDLVYLQRWLLGETD